MTSLWSGSDYVQWVFEKPVVTQQFGSLVSHVFISHWELLFFILLLTVHASIRIGEKKKSKKEALWNGCSSLMLKQPVYMPKPFNQYLPVINGVCLKQSTLIKGTHNLNSEQFLSHIAVFFRVVLAEVPHRNCFLSSTTAFFTYF